jgi:hypothetical protein
VLIISSKDLKIPGNAERFMELYELENRLSMRLQRHRTDWQRLLSLQYGIGIVKVQRPPNSPYFAPSDFPILVCVKRQLKRFALDTSDDLLSAFQAILSRIDKNDANSCFSQLNKGTSTTYWHKRRVDYTPKRKVNASCIDFSSVDSERLIEDARSLRMRRLHLLIS